MLVNGTEWVGHHVLADRVRYWRGHVWPGDLRWTDDCGCLVPNEPCQLTVTFPWRARAHTHTVQPHSCGRPEQSGSKWVRATLQLWRNSGCGGGDPPAFAPQAPRPSPEPSPFQGIGGRTGSLAGQEQGGDDTGICDGGTESSSCEPLPSTGSRVTSPASLRTPACSRLSPAPNCVLGQQPPPPGARRSAVPSGPVTAERVCATCVVRVRAVVPRRVGAL